MPRATHHHDPDWHVDGLTVGQVAERSGLAPSAIRFYDRKGLLRADRTTGNRRRFRGDVLCRVAMIGACRRVGLTLAEIHAALAALPDDRPPGPAEWQELSEHLQREAGLRIRQLQEALDELVAGAILPPSAMAGPRR
ncbi:hypothetical protein GCM10011609_34000 [Lentzea pudingi]|uniref:HTH merR-type domain-containing protein n=1 Tax=Lentzea pudingi TaxID=1789439 RepID=A0ABQ2HXL0_9PSEU|nr:MerR family transcriptional regulator [Lentzea pudingi]GGM93755.1 hypothetical protein GCM10011609_34000 [Lentzea pudingi]